jgi:hypothetical protein
MMMLVPWLMAVAIFIRKSKDLMEIRIEGISNINAWDCLASDI